MTDVDPSNGFTQIVHESYEEGCHVVDKETTSNRKTAKNIGSGHIYYILKSNGMIITRSTVTHLFDEGNTSETM